jgi:hypothetical protein
VATTLDGYAASSSRNAGLEKAARKCSTDSQTA